MFALLCESLECESLNVYDRMFISRFVDSSLFLFLFIITLIKFHAIHMQATIIGKACTSYAHNRYDYSIHIFIVDRILIGCGVCACVALIFPSNCPDTVMFFFNSQLFVLHIQSNSIFVGLFFRSAF